MDAVSLAVLLALGGIFMSSGAAKLRGGRFAPDVANYRILPIGWVLPVAAVLPWVEVAIGVSLVVSPWPVPVLVAGVVMLGAFTVGITINLTRGRRIPCGCRGAATQISWALAARNAAWVVVAAWVATTAPAPAASTLLGTASPVGGWGVVASLGVAAILWRLAAESWQLKRASDEISLALSRVAQP